MQAAIQKPNIIYISADGLGHGMLSCYRVTASGAERDARGGERQFRPPPNFDRLEDFAPIGKLHPLRRFLADMVIVVQPPLPRTPCGSGAD